jgi:DNA-binding winged helix-turn-helix (wHTH) protein
VAICFGDYSFDVASGTLLRLGHPVHLRPRASKLLAILLENQPRIVAKSELTQRLWPDAHVSAGSLPNLVLELRRALHDERDAALVRTMHGAGYAFVGETWEGGEDAAARPGRFRLVFEGREKGLVAGENWIGRAASCAIQVWCSKVSRKHARIVITADQAMLEDAGSRNGTFLSGRRLRAPARLRHGDLIRVGSVPFTFQVMRPDVATDAD